MKTFIRKLSLCICLMLAVFMFAKPVQAAMKNLGSFTGTKTFSVDMTHDGKADKVKFAVTKENGDYINKVRIYLNGKLVKTESKDSGALTLYVQYLKYSGSREFLYLYGVGDSGMPYYQHIYSYDKSTKSFKIVCDLSKYTAACKAISSVRGNDDSFAIKYNAMPSPIGRISWTYRYRYNAKTGKFKLVKSTAAAKCTMTTYDPGDGLTSYFKKNMYKTAKSVIMCSDKNCTNIAFTVPYGKFVKLMNVYCKADGSMYAQFKYGSKTGWIKIKTEDGSWSDPNYGAFQGMNNRQAGGFFS